MIFKVFKFVQMNGNRALAKFMSPSNVSERVFMCGEASECVCVCAFVHKTYSSQKRRDKLGSCRLKFSCDCVSIASDRRCIRIVLVLVLRIFTLSKIDDCSFASLCNNGRTKIVCLLFGCARNFLSYTLRCIHQSYNRMICFSVISGCV